MKIKILISQLVALSIVSAANVFAQNNDTTFVLLNVSFDGPFSIRELTFTETSSGEEFHIRDIQKIGRRGAPRFFIQEVSAGEYYLSGIAPTINRSENVPSIDVDRSSGTIQITPGRINYIGDIYIYSDETASNAIAIKELSYTPNSATLRSAVQAEKELFENSQTVISIANSDPIPVAKELLGL